MMSGVAKPTVAASRGLGRDLSIDSTRFVGFMAVALLHVVSRTSGSFDLYTVIDHACRWAVPVYFMISGYLFEASSRSTADKWWRMMIRLGIIFLFWEAVYLFANFAWLHNYKMPPSLGRFAFHTITRGGAAWHLWFIPSLAVCVTVYCLLRLLPWSARLVAAALLFCLGVLLNAYSPLIGLAKPLPTTPGPLFGTVFVAAGAYISQIKPLRNSFFWLALALASLMLQMFEVHWVSKIGNAPVAPYDFVFFTLPFGFASFMFFQTSTFFRENQISATLGRLALGMYCVHVLFLEGARQMLGVGAEPAGYGAAAVIYLCVIAGSILTSLLLSKLPLIRAVVS